MVMPALDAAEILAASGISAGVINARFAKPLDEELILEAAGKYRALVTVEEAYLAGGFGSAILELLESKGLSDSVSIVRLGVPDEIVPHGDPKRLLARYGLDAEGIARGAVEALNRADENRGANKLRIVG
jgi:1-deoxy-D-xylulose-5-phosphate synthase